MTVDGGDMEGYVGQYNGIPIIVNPFIPRNEVYLLNGQLRSRSPQKIRLGNSFDDAAEQRKEEALEEQAFTDLLLRMLDQLE